MSSLRVPDVLRVGWGRDPLHSAEAVSVFESAPHFSFRDPICNQFTPYIGDMHPVIVRGEMMKFDRFATSTKEKGQQGKNEEKRPHGADDGRGIHAWQVGSGVDERREIAAGSQAIFDLISSIRHAKRR